MGSSELLFMPSPLGTSKYSSLAWGSPPQVAAHDLHQPLSVTVPHPEGSSLGQDPFMKTPGQLPSVGDLGVSVEPTLCRHL